MQRSWYKFLFISKEEAFITGATLRSIILFLCFLMWHKKMEGKEAYAIYNNYDVVSYTDFIPPFLNCSRKVAAESGTSAILPLPYPLPLAHQGNVKQGVAPE